MTAVSAPAGAGISPLRATLAGTGALTRFMLRRDRVKFPGWVGGFAFFVLYLVTAVPAAYGSEEELAAAAQLFADPVGRVMIGPGYGFDAPALERFVANGYGLYFFLMAAVMNILLVTRHTRVEEQTGRAELVRANVVGRHAPLTAALIVALVTNLGVALVAFLVLVGVGGFAATGSAVFAVAIAVSGFAFAGVTALTVQVSQYSRAAAGLAGVVLGVAFLLRAGGDMVRQGGSALSWTSPLGWGTQTAPFVLDRWWPLVLSLAWAAVTVAAGYAVASHRDLGASLFTVRPGNRRAAPRLGTPLGLALRMQRASIIGWTLATFVGALSFGAYVDALEKAAADMPAAFLELFGGAETMQQGYLAYMALYMAYMVTIYVILAVHRLRSDEHDGYLQAILAAPVSRWNWLGANVAVTALGTLVLMAVSGLGIGVGAVLVTGRTEYLSDLTLGTLNHVPDVLVVLAVAVLLLGLAPRALAVVWMLFGFGFFMGTFGPLLKLPQALSNVSPYAHTANMPLESFDPVPFVVLLGLAAVLTSVGAVGFRRRDLQLP